jgi:hypothetical protein
MPRLKSNEVPLQLVIPKEAYAALKTMAKREEIKSVSELVRRLLESYCQNAGLDVSFHIGDWGGKRQKATALKSQQADESLQPIDIKRADGKIVVTLADGRVIAHPLAWYPWLMNATPEQFANYTANPTTIYWPDLEDGLSIDTLLRGPVKKEAMQA